MACIGHALGTCGWLPCDAAGDVICLWCCAADSAAGAGAQPGYDGKGEYFTQDEMAAMFKPKKKKVHLSFSAYVGSECACSYTGHICW